MSPSLATRFLRQLPLAAMLCIGSDFLFACTARAEDDHLKGYTAKDLNQVPASPNPLTLDNPFGTESCELKKPFLLLAASEKNGGDDPRSGPAGNFVCYKAKCSGALPPITDADSQFGLHQLQAKKAKVVCLPLDALQVCGNGVREGTETCDGSDATACPGACLTDCTCPAATCGNNVREGTEECDGTDATACPGDCQVDCTCPTPTCGNNVQEGTEECDGTDDSICNFAFGPLANCRADCTCEPNPCETSAHPTCGGGCPAGETCETFISTCACIPNASSPCGGTSPGACPDPAQICANCPAQVCGVSIYFCTSGGCSGSPPTCGGAECLPQESCVAGPIPGTCGCAQ
jgi:hypothetical protein